MRVIYVPLLAPLSTLVVIAHAKPKCVFVKPNDRLKIAIALPLIRIVRRRPFLSEKIPQK